MEAELDFNKCSDETLIDIYRKGDEAAIEVLFERYKDIVRKKAKAMYLAGGDSDDLIQEGMIGLYKAVRDYDDTKEAAFKTFASMCINRQLINAVADLRVDVIGSACQDHDPLAVRSGIGQRLLALGPHLGCVIGIRGKPGIHRPGDLAPGDCHVVPVQRGVQCPPQRGLAVDIQVGVPEVRLLQVLHIALQQLRIRGDNGAVIMVYAGLFIHRGSSPF